MLDREGGAGEVDPLGLLPDLEGNVADPAVATVQLDARGDHQGIEPVAGRRRLAKRAGDVLLVGHVDRDPAYAGGVIEAIEGLRPIQGVDDGAGRGEARYEGAAEASRAAGDDDALPWISTSLRPSATVVKWCIPSYRERA